MVAPVLRRHSSTIVRERGCRLGRQFVPSNEEDLSIGYPLDQIGLRVEGCGKSREKHDRIRKDEERDYSQHKRKEIRVKRTYLLYDTHFVHAVVV